SPKPDTRRRTFLPTESGNVTVPSVPPEAEGTLRPRAGGSDDSAERRQMTVMFCDLVGSTRMSAKLDPEEFREVERGFRDMSVGVVSRFGGHLAQYRGDAILIYFGYPSSHEGDAEQAVRAALAIVKAMEGQSVFSTALR